MTTLTDKYPHSAGQAFHARSGSVQPRESEMRFDALLQSTYDAVIATNRQGMIIFWNHAAEVLFGYGREEALGASIEIIIPDSYINAHRAGLQRVAGGGERHVIGRPVELSGKHREGRAFPIELTLSTWDVGTETYFAGIIRDISQRKEHERAILESERRFRSLTETASDAIISANSSGHIVSWNAAAQRIFGYTEEEACGQLLDVIIPVKYREGHRKGLHRVASGGKPHITGQTLELEGLHKDGHVFPIELSLSSWQTDQGMHFCGIIRDISERKKHEKALKQSKARLLRQTEKLRIANAQIRDKTFQLQNLSQKLAKYLSHQVYNSIFEGERDVKIESYRKQLTVFFSDIQGFTALSDRVEAEVLTQVLNSYLNEMSIIANAHGGTIDKFIGDAIMIFFGDPETRGTKEDALACVRMALHMQKRLIELQSEWEKMGVDRPLKVRMGINTGFCTVGNFGSEERMDYTIVGSNVNLAHRLESHAESNQILIAHSTYLLIRDEIACTSRQEIRVKGFSEPVLTYQVLGEKQSQPTDVLNQQLEKIMTDVNLALQSHVGPEKIREMLEHALTLVSPAATHGR